MNSQEIKYIPVKDLVLWTENPRDPIDVKALDQDIVDIAIEDKRTKWELKKLAKEMGNYFDFSELPTVVYNDGKPIVYDGNRRVILAKIKLGLVTIPKSLNINNLPDVPQDLPCNVCGDKKVAIENVYRKHAESGSWDPLERDIFVHNFMGEPKSSFLILEEDTGIITANPHLNQRFVKEEIFKDDALNSMGFSIEKGRLHSTHSDNDAKRVLSDISDKIEQGTISTRKNRGKILDVLEPESKQLISKNASKDAHLSNVRFDESEIPTQSRQTRRTRKKANELFGGKLYLRAGDVSNLHRDISDLYDFYCSNKNKLSPSFPGIIRMSLRLLCETASANKKFSDYLKDNFETAKQTLDQDKKTTLSVQNVTKESISQLLNTGAHSYTSTSNIEQTIALSIIIGAILTLTHGKEQ